MRGHYVPLPDHGGITSTASEEIQEAIDEIRFSPCAQENVIACVGSVRDSRKDRTETCSRPTGIVVLGPMDRLDAATIVSVYGRAPRAFFQWFEELRSQLKDQQQMLEHCRFEEGWWSFDRW